MIYLIFAFTSIWCSKLNEVEIAEDDTFFFVITDLDIRKIQVVSLEGFDNKGPSKVLENVSKIDKDTSIYKIQLVQSELLSYEPVVFLYKDENDLVIAHSILVLDDNRRILKGFGKGKYRRHQEKEAFSCKNLRLNSTDKEGMVFFVGSDSVKVDAMMSF